MTRRIGRTFAVVSFGLLILRDAGLRLALQKLVHQLYCRTLFIGTVKRLDEPPRASTFECYVMRASPGDVEEFFANVASESGEGGYQLLVRRWYHERGFGDCYVTRVKGTDEVCAARWMVTARHLQEMGWEERYPGLNGTDVLLENIYVLERFRGMGVQRSSSPLMARICIEMGYTHAKGWIAEDNRIGECLRGLWNSISCSALRARPWNATTRQSPSRFRVRRLVLRRRGPLRRRRSSEPHGSTAGCDPSE